MPFIDEPEQLDTLDGMAAFVQEAVKQIGAEFRDPDDDWINVLAIRSKRGVEIMPLQGQLFEHASGKDLLGELMRRMVADRGAYRYALLINAFAARIPKEEFEQWLEGDERVSERPDRVEMLVLLVGDAEQERMYSSEIAIDGDGVRHAGPWRESPEAWESRFAHLNAYLRGQL